MNRHQVGVAAEAHAAAVFAQAGYSVFVQYGANQPGYDLVVSDNKKTVFVSVKGSTNGGWMLTAKGKNGTYEQAFDDWQKKNQNYVFCYVQYQGVEVGQMPRMYLAFGWEVVAHQQTGWWGQLALSLIENKTMTRGENKGITQSIPREWKMSKKRIQQIFKNTAL